MSYARVRDNHRKPIITIRTLEPDYMVFEMSNTDASSANALRRVMVAEVPTIAIDLVEMENNTTVLNDEFLSHRLGLIPLKSDEAINWKRPFEWSSDNDIIETQFSLDVSCTEDGVMDVTANDLIPLVPEHRVVPVNYHHGEEKPIVICKLRRGQALKLTARARKGIGKDHAKWIPVATAVFQYKAKITLNHSVMADMSDDDKQAFVASDPSKTFKWNPITRMIEVDNEESYTFDEECVKKAQELGKPDLVNIQQIQDHFIFRVEGTGVLPVNYVVRRAMEILQGKCNDLAQLAKEAANPDAAHAPGGTLHGGMNGNAGMDGGMDGMGMAMGMNGGGGMGGGMGGMPGGGGYDMGMGQGGYDVGMAGGY